MRKVKSSTQVLDEKAVLTAMEGSLAMIEFERQGKVIWANENFANTLGYKVTELKGMFHNQFCTSSYAASKEYNDLWRNLLQGLVFQEKIERVAKDGRLIILEATYTPVLNERGEVEAVIKIATDITEREQNTNNIASELHSMSKNMQDRAEKGIEKIKDAAADTEKIANESKQNLQVLNTLKTQTDSIQKVVKTIHEIAVQTNILAINAKIESARAGQYGRGFSVVADEVGKLANNVKIAVQNVELNVKEMSSELEKIHHSQTSIGDVQILIQKAVEEFKNIEASSQELNVQAEVFKNIV
ncbi:methyl-accepting chemotaxis protein [Metabacillus fastidiosus]|uniref:methyl-accepting chemotaxis protein n=1 Tax=Metabacillus fastidiosus TaxID=1458 RepID=UPI002DBEF7B0|nr:methyl-accepting chemotaxis protein [Metabacillus fastidiosus]MEC2078410.1 methyl-accepting chemotaxis protein [Metabacillus fastidiosus]